MTLVPLLTILLPHITLTIAAYQSAILIKDQTRYFDAHHLIGVYNNCQSPDNGTFCMGSKAAATGFPEGHGCLKDRDCDAIMLATRESKPSHKNSTILWTFYLKRVPELESLHGHFYLMSTASAISKTPSDFDPNVLLMANEGTILDPPGRLSVVGTNEKGRHVITNLDKKHAETLYHFKDTAIVNGSSKSLEMVLLSFTSPDIISCPPLKYKVNTQKDVFPVMVTTYSENQVITSNAHQPSAIKLFARGAYVPTKINETTVPGQSKMPSTLPSSGRSNKQNIGLASLMAIATVTSVMKSL